jgi:SAM-dependent methyltransferase
MTRDIASSTRFAPRGRLRAAAYRLLLRCGDICGSRGNVFLHLAAGLLQRADLEDASLQEWRTFATSDSEVDADLTDDERRVYSQYLRAGKRVLLVGCGAGRDLLSLAEMGLDVTGIDQVPELISLARTHLQRRRLRGRVQLGEIATVTTLAGPFDAVVFSIGSYSFVRSSRARIAALARIAAHLRPDGRVLISYYPAVRRSPIGPRLTKFCARLAGADWTMERGDVFSRLDSTSGVLRYQHNFDAQEISDECEAAGLCVVSDEPFGVLRVAAVIPRSAKTASQTSGSAENTLG